MNSTQEAKEWKPLLDELTLALRQLHKALVDEEAAAYARKFAPVAGRADLLRLLTTHEHFAWLRVLSELMVDVDELRAGAAVARGDLQGLRSTIEGLVGPRPASLAPFRARYIALMQRTPQVAMAHHALRQVLQRLPAGDGETTSDELHERHVETEGEKHVPPEKDG